MSLRLWLLLLALMGAQALGLMHRVLHTHDVLPASLQRALLGEARAVGTRAQPTEATHSHWLAHVFSDHGVGECRLFDQLVYGDQAPVPLAAPLLSRCVESIAPCWLTELQLVVRPVPFDARAPPVPHKPVFT